MKAGPEPLVPDARGEAAQYIDWLRKISRHLVQLQGYPNSPLLVVVGVLLPTTVIWFLKRFKVATLNEATSSTFLGH